MATIIHPHATVQPNGKIEITAPELQPGQQVNITIEAHEPPSTHQKRRAAAILAEAPSHQLSRPPKR